MKSPPPAIAVRSCPNHTSSRSVPSLPADDSDTPGHSPNSEYCLERGIPQTPATAWSVGRTPMTGFDREQKRRKIPTLTYLFPFEQLRFFARYDVGFPCNDVCTLTLVGPTGGKLYSLASQSRFPIPPAPASPRPCPVYPASVPLPWAMHSRPLTPPPPSR